MTTTFDAMQKAQKTYRHGISVTLGMGGLQDLIPTTEREWVLFDTNQYLRDRGKAKPLPWPDEPPVAWTSDDLLDALTRAEARA